MNCYFHNKRVVGRKTHQCDACGHTIEPGWFSIVEAGVYQGEFFHRRTHPICHEIWFQSHQDEELGDFWDCLDNWLSSNLDYGDFEKAWRYVLDGR